MTRPTTRLFWLICVCLLAMGIVACEKGSKVRKNAFGAPSLSAPSKGGGGKAFVVPENLIPPGAAATKTDTGLSDRIYATQQRATEVQAFFATALPNAAIQAVREGEHVTVKGDGWLIEVYGGGEGAPTTIVYAQEKEL